MSDMTGEPIFRPTERFTLDPKSPMPLYHQLEQVLLDRITRADAVGRMLPSEQDLTRIFGVSRATVQKTFNSLVAKGLVERRRALGTRVLGEAITEDLARLNSYTEEMASKGLHVSTEVLEIDARVPQPEVSEKLQLREGEEVLYLRRLCGTSQRFPVVLLTSQIPMSFGVRPTEDFGGSLYRLIEQEHGIPVEWAQQEILAAGASEEEARLLGLAPGDNVLVMQRVTFTRNNRPLEYVRGVYNAEHYRYSVRLRR